MSWNAKCADCSRASGICATESKDGLESWRTWGDGWSCVIFAKKSEGGLRDGARGVIIGGVWCDLLVFRVC
jgi:hypothetical protein